MRIIGMFLLGFLIGAAVPVSAQQVVRIYGTLAGTPATPQALIVDATGALMVVAE